MQILDQPAVSFQGFKDLTKNYSLFKMLMSAVQNKRLSENLVNEILPVWKNQTIIQAKLYKVSKCGSLLAQWINLLVEYNLKKETIMNSKVKEPEMEKKTAASLAIVNDLAKELLLIEEIIEKKQTQIEAKIEAPHEEFTERFRFVQGAAQSEPPVLSPGRGRGELSGILTISDLNIVRNNGFPDFNGEDLYGENSVKMIEPTILYESRGIDVGCCKLKFFCF